MLDLLLNRFVILGLLLLSMFSYGQYYRYRYNHEHEGLLQLQAEQEALLKYSNEISKQKEQEGKENATQIANDYASNIVAIRKYYDGLRNTKGPITRLSQSNTSTQGTSSTSTEQLSIEEDCSVTTEMLNKLQEYYGKNVAPFTR